MIPNISPITIKTMIFAGSVLTLWQNIIPYLSKETITPKQPTHKKEDTKKDYKREADDAREREKQALAREKLAIRNAEIAAQLEELARTKEEKAKQDANEQKKRAEDAESKLAAGCMAEKNDDLKSIETRYSKVNQDFIDLENQETTEKRLVEIIKVSDANKNATQLDKIAHHINCNERCIEELLDTNYITENTVDYLVLEKGQAIKKKTLKI